MTRVIVVGTGQLGSRHLQALRRVSRPLKITAVDPSPESLRVARERFEAVAPGADHTIDYQAEVPRDGRADLAIVATSSNTRRRAVEDLLSHPRPRWMILEKLLFQRPQDYDEVGEMLRSSGADAWVNCTMRAVPFYRRIKNNFGGSPVSYHVTGSRYGLITNAIHYIDHVAFLAEDDRFSVDTSMLDPTPIASKRAGFLELNGTLRVTFSGGAHGVITCYAEGDAPVLVEIQSERGRCIVRESEGRAWMATPGSDWKYHEVEARIPLQSEMTTEWVESLLRDGELPLVRYDESARIHRQLLDPLVVFLNRSGRHELYPFT